MNWRGIVAVGFAVAAMFGPSCGGGGGNRDICDCSPTETNVQDFRHDVKHIPLPAGTPQEISVSTILAWAIPPTPANNSPRTGKELQLFHIAHAFARDVRLVPGDCDLHVEISETADANAPRMIVETPIDSEYCPNRRALQSALHQLGFDIGTNEIGEVPQPVPVEVTGLAFLDIPHNRGSALVTTTWEIHPALVNVLPQ